MEQTIKQARLLKIPAKPVQAVSPNCFQASSLLQVTTHAKLLNNNVQSQPQNLIPTMEYSFVTEFVTFILRKWTNEIRHVVD